MEAACLCVCRRGGEEDEEVAFEAAAVVLCPFTRWQVVDV
jgi:hypothetical protein